MNKLLISLTALAICGAPASAQTDVSKVLADTSRRVTGALAVVRYKITDETGERTAAGQAVCIDAKGVFMTTALDPGVPVAQLKDLELLPAGAPRKTIKAKLLGIDPGTRLGFVQAIESYPWKAVAFQASSNVTPGQQVLSGGVMMNDPSFTPCLGVAYVSALLRVPGRLVFVTGGKLTPICSPVFTTDGRAVGIVGAQMYLSYQTATQRGAAALRLRGQQETAFFTPVEEFIHVLQNIPRAGKVRRPAWLGVGKYEPVNEETAKLMKLEQTGIMLDQVIPDYPAEAAGLKNRDVVVGLNGKPIEELATPSLTVQQFAQTLLRLKVGETVELSVRSGSAARKVAIKLVAMPTTPNEAKRLFSRELGFIIREKVTLDQHLDKGPTASMPGMIVVAVARNSPAEGDGLQQGDLVIKLNDTDVSTVVRFKEILEATIKADPTAPLSFLVQRGNQAQTIKIRAPGR